MPRRERSSFRHLSCQRTTEPGPWSPLSRRQTPDSSDIQISELWLVIMSRIRALIGFTLDHLKVMVTKRDNVTTWHQPIMTETTPGLLIQWEHVSHTITWYAIWYRRSNNVMTSGLRIHTLQQMLDPKCRFTQSANLEWKSRAQVPHYS